MKIEETTMPKTFAPSRLLAMGISLLLNSFPQTMGEQSSLAGLVLGEVHPNCEDGHIARERDCEV